MTDPESVKVKLLPCPFCGGEASADGHVKYSRPQDSTWADGTPVSEAFSVNCLRCFANTHGWIGGQQTKSEAVAAWNHRTPTDPEQIARIDELTRERDAARRLRAETVDLEAAAMSRALAAEQKSSEWAALAGAYDGACRQAEQQLADAVEEVFRFGFRACVARPLATMDDDPKAEDDAARAFLASINEQTDE